MLSGLGLTDLAVLALAALAMDWVLGGARRWHLIAAIHWLADLLERRLNRRAHRGSGGAAASYWRGVLAWSLLVLPLTAGAVLLTRIEDLGLLAHGLLLYACIGLRRLREHALPVAQALQARDLTLARRLAGSLSGRNHAESESEAISRMRVQTLLAEGNDAVLGTLFWFFVAGGPGALAFRLANALAARWETRSRRFQNFGCHAGRAGWAMNLVPARLTALSYVLLAKSGGQRQRAWACWRSQVLAWSGRPAAPVLASGAEALGLRLDESADPQSGKVGPHALQPGRLPSAADIRRAWQLVAGACLLWTGLLAAAAALRWLFF